MYRRTDFSTSYLHRFVMRFNAEVDRSGQRTEDKIRIQVLAVSAWTRFHIYLFTRACARTHMHRWCRKSPVSTKMHPRHTVAPGHP